MSAANARHAKRRKVATAVDGEVAIANAKRAILQAVPGIIEALIKKAKSGSYLHANFLFAFAGVNEADDEEESSGEESLMQQLLRQLDDTEPPVKDAGVESAGQAR